MKKNPWFTIMMVVFILIAFWSGYRLGRSVEKDQTVETMKQMLKEKRI